MIMNTIEVRCKAADLLPIDRIVEFQGDLKTLTKNNREKLQRSILRHGFIAPFFVWDDHGEWRLLDGHQRLATLIYMRENYGYDIPLLPVSYIEADSEDDAKRKLLQITSQYGEFTTEGYEDFVFDLDLIDEDFRLTNGEFTLNDEQDNPYSAKIEVPVYEPKGDMPLLLECYDTSKTDAIIRNIDNSSQSEPIKEMLRAAAYRHAQFRYDNIAELYAHSNAELQRLMEESALVLIDFDKAIEYGFVEMTEKLRELYTDG